MKDNNKKQAVLWEPADDKKVRCGLCNFRCLINDGKLGQPVSLWTSRLYKTHGVPIGSMKMCLTMNRRQFFLSSMSGIMKMS